MHVERFKKLVEIMVEILLPISLVIGRIPRIGRKLRHILPLANYKKLFPLSKTHFGEWAILDTFDMLLPPYDHFQSTRKLATLFVESGFRDGKLFRAGQLIGSEIKT